MKRLLKLVLVVAIVAGIAKLIMTKQEWSGLTEAQVRDKLDTGLARKVEDAEKRQEIADKVVTAMKDKGVLREDPAVESAVEAAEDAIAEETHADAEELDETG
jgi:hypothetical protein